MASTILIIHRGLQIIILTLLLSDVYFVCIPDLHEPDAIQTISYVSVYPYYMNSINGDLVGNS